MRLDILISIYKSKTSKKKFMSFGSSKTDLFKSDGFGILQKF